MSHCLNYNYTELINFLSIIQKELKQLKSHKEKLLFRGGVGMFFITAITILIGKLQFFWFLLVC